ncbi:ABC transporter substrate binding protein (PQQ-dependent alcohol dehydrogenase system) [Rhodobacter aestuarii]|uniref:ABC transporter, substrate binding protein, PQQ-dependent alcohol dehydrogenase system n=1 Tax=Rhodobacter aestuarii TaxID=453582 RepID=A0A1N7IWR4_9RHOB|nr:ABC transporter substrate-binding protein [Rhodobacter aestuarii]PTV97451.1 ABC transporter substrate binding protein (PQQ-dependent alcohol dehydrogenase system) [Rhodobacter aestuarii]SIS41538.1 ABC transporter, substrate binding protein, PQQ-dependent alcohol dehydrogenase system [Rhodobacter aestuarii]
MKLLATAAALGLACASAQAEALRLDWIERQVVPPPVLSNLQGDPDDLGLAGARLSLKDIAKTGKFLGIDWALQETVVPPEADFLEVAKAALADGAQILITRAPAKDLLALADLPQAQGALILNTGADETRLRGADCRANVLHTLPSVAMRTDALAQLLVAKRWTDLALISGPQPEDAAYAEALKASLTKFGLALSGEKDWPLTADMRRSGAAEVPLFTQDLPKHDILLVADERGDFARYLPYNTWLPRPIAGSEGLVPRGWSGVVEQNGAAQLQDRFRAAIGREMRAEDYAAWVAVAAISDARTRAGSATPEALRAYLTSEKARIAGFLGRPLSFRPWDGQMRQPIPLVTERAVIALAPLEGFLHAHNELDTLGPDRPETLCTAFGG